MTGKPWFWPAAIGFILCLGVGANVVLLVVANSDPSFAVEEDYYQKGLDWDAKRAQDARNEALGWHLDLAAVAAVGEETPSLELTVALRDPDRVAVDGAALTIEAFPLARSATVDRAAFRAVGGGLYRASLPFRRPGLWEFRIRVERGDDVFTWLTQKDVEGPWPRS
jgi:nitrogen fixation protein FixH